MKKLTIRWQRLVDETGRTCERCSSTERSVDASFVQLRKSLSGLGIDVELKKEMLAPSAFKEDPLKSNCIWIQEKPLEEWIGANVGRSQCCDVCGEAECRTVSTGQKTFETIPAQIIIQAGLLAAADLLKN
ncbi:MAG: DUF2703 domain-containing protein [Desulfuromonadales bacterium]|nr:DUF2703 domain-containing protein [Desulfuromonadales bacterium]